MEPNILSLLKSHNFPGLTTSPFFSSFSCKMSRNYSGASSHINCFLGRAHLREQRRIDRLCACGLSWSTCGSITEKNILLFLCLSSHLQILGNAEASFVIVHYYHQTKGSYTSSNSWCSSTPPLASTPPTPPRPGMRRRLPSNMRMVMMI